MITKNLMFDLGGVIMDIRRENCVRAFEALGLSNANDLLGEYSQRGVFAGVENGSLTADEFRSEIRSMIGKTVTDKEIDDAFEAFLIGIPVERLRQLEKLHRNHRLLLLSNTNPIMWNHKISQEFAKDGHTVDYYFDGVLRSYEAGVMKPDLKIFRLAQERFGIKPEETIFIDDSQRNLDAAAVYGFGTLLVAPGEEFADKLLV